jgi:hypothetical protein
LGISDNATGSLQTVVLSGTGSVSIVAPHPPVLPRSRPVNAPPLHTLNPLVPVVRLSSSALTFSAQIVGTSSSAQTVTLTNPGDDPLTISGITTSEGFSQTNTCGSTLSPGDDCAISVTFKPVASGTKTGTLSISNNPTDSPQTVALSGTGLVPAVDVAPEHPEHVQ